MSSTTIWLSKDFKDELAIQKIKDGKSTFEELIKAMYEQYKKDKEEK